MRIPFLSIVVYGFLTYAVVFMLWAFLYSYGIASVLVYGAAASIINYVVVTVAVFVAIRHVGIASAREALVYGIGLALVHILLDVIYIPPAASLNALFESSMWINYALVAVTPFATILYTRSENTRRVVSNNHRGDASMISTP